jgi:hypothetical protein
MSQSNPASRGGIGFTGALTIAFIVLKLCGVIHWSWVWVLAPLWISVLLACLFVAVFVATLFGVIVVSICKTRLRKPPTTIS